MGNDSSAPHKGSTTALGDADRAGAGALKSDPLIETNVSPHPGPVKTPSGHSGSTATTGRGSDFTDRSSGLDALGSPPSRDSSLGGA